MNPSEPPITADERAAALRPANTEYEPPALTDLGSFADLTRGHPSAGASDLTFANGSFN